VALSDERSHASIIFGCGLITAPGAGIDDDHAEVNSTHIRTSLLKFVFRQPHTSRVNDASRGSKAVARIFRRLPVTSGPLERLYRVLERR
jgi:hypothetical protein